MPAIVLCGVVPCVTPLYSSISLQQLVTIKYQMVWCTFKLSNILLNTASMKKNLLILFLLVLTISCFCQNTSLPKINGDTLYTTVGYKIYVDQQIKLGIGTKDNGDFKYITSSSFLTAPNARQPSLREHANGHMATVKKLKTTGNSKNGYVYHIVIGVGEPVNYECDVESAIAAGEIVVPDQYKTKTTTSTAPTSVADEIAKLKKLCDDSVITKEEFEAQKKKLLDGNQ